MYGITEKGTETAEATETNQYILDYIHHTSYHWEHENFMYLLCVGINENLPTISLLYFQCSRDK